ncbi:M24 family metallopeptidase [Natrialba taiwanensis]|uniref:Peptidase M24 n=1 Tax=Natrialba taiwanensis DSM 12281 TaxID=1230458 RepID=L9ZIX6_9EURY|nr:Xaa-Pro peptidase family protein [Natrialba taiwanensis]ELY85103.1 peptidase M24 [Natrialba taiwanensis DSM 12281]
MTPAIPQLTAFLDRAGTDGYLLDADGNDSHQYYLSGYHMLDEFVTLYADERVTLLLPGPECSQAERDSNGDEIRSRAEFRNAAELEDMDPRKARKRVTVDFLDAAGIDSVSVPVSFPVGTADLLREHGIEVVPEYEYVLDEIRAVKHDREIDHIRETQRAAEDGMAAAEDLLERATVADGVLHLDGDVLTSERVRERIERAVLDRGCGLDQCIVASGPAGARAHDPGTGPLRANVPIIIDIFPRHKRTRYFGDMTRTVVKGTPSDRTREWYALVSEASEAALDTIRAGVTGETVHAAVCDVFESAGYPTGRTADDPDSGFPHATGHGVGLDVHEAPYLAQQAGELEAGHVVTVEPGLYEQGTGGVRLEDLVVVTDDGYETMNDYPRDLRVV